MKPAESHGRIVDRIAADLDELERLLPRLQERLSERPPPEPRQRRGLRDALGLGAAAQFAGAATGYTRSR